MMVGGGMGLGKDSNNYQNGNSKMINDNSNSQTLL
jgi:hypothetical protein